MEKILHDVLNAGIALFRSGEDSVNKAVSDIQKTFDELKSRGAADNSEPAQKLRKNLDDIVQQTNNLSSQAGSTYNETLVKIDELYQNAMTEIQKIVPEDKVNEFKDKIDELNKTIRERVDGLKSGGNTGSSGAGSSTGAGPSSVS